MGASLIMAGTSDLSGMLRGKGFAARDLDAKAARGVGWTPTNAQITCFDTIAPSPYGALGDLVLRPDPATLVEVPLPSGRVLGWALGDIHDLDGAPWECCTRGALKAALARLREVSGLTLRTTFEHEFMVPGIGGDQGSGAAFSLAGFHEGLPLLEALHEALRGAGMEPDSLLREYGPDQFEVTLPPQEGVRAADEAAALREVVRAVAREQGHRASFAPLLAPDIVGNGVHVHLSLWDAEGRPATHDPASASGLSGVAASFAAGILAHMEAVAALSAPSVISPLRLVPHRWSAAFNNLGRQDREAMLRICPVTATDPAARARQFNMEMRAADACASPHLALAAIVIAGTLGIEASLPAPEVTAEDLSLLGPDALGARGLRRLPDSLEAALDGLHQDAAFTERLPGQLPAIYDAHKRGEAAHIAPLDERTRLDAYARVY